MRIYYRRPRYAVSIGPLGLVLLCIWWAFLAVYWWPLVLLYKALKWTTISLVQITWAIVRTIRRRRATTT